MGDWQRSLHNIVCEALYCLHGFSFEIGRKMPPHIAKAFDEGILSGKNIQWGSIGPNGLCFFSLANNIGIPVPARNYSARNANFDQFTAPKMRTCLQM
jgi:hypothetical protein